MRRLTRVTSWLLALVLCPSLRCVAGVADAGVCPASVTDVQLIWEPSGFFDEIMRPALPPQEPLGLQFSDRILIRLVDAESRETDPWLRDDIRIARVTVGFARRGSPIPHIEASYAVLGVHPDQIWPRILARREALQLDVVRKPVQSVRLGAVRKTA